MRPIRGLTLLADMVVSGPEDDPYPVLDADGIDALASSAEARLAEETNRLLDLDWGYISEWIVRVVRDDLDGGWVASIPQLPGCMSQGETVPEALANIADAFGGIGFGTSRPNKADVPNSTHQGHAMYEGGWISYRDFERILLALGASGSDVKRLWPTNDGRHPVPDEKQVNAIMRIAEEADQAASIAHDFIWGRGGVTREDASAAIWQIHKLLRPLYGYVGE